MLALFQDKVEVAMVNVLLSTYNGEKYIKEQLDSIRMQSYRQYHVYIRDDGSTDNTISIILEYIDNLPPEEKMQFSFRMGENVGFCKSFFKLMKMAQEGDYWAFCDQDDKWLPDKLKHAIQWLDEIPKEKPAFYHSGICLGNEDLSEKKPYPNPKFEYGFPNCFTSNIFFGFSMTINRGLYERILWANPDNIKYHDWFGAMIAATFGTYHMSQQVDSIHRMHETNSSPLFFFKKIPDGIRLLKGDTFYTKNAREFYRLFEGDLGENQKKQLALFLNHKYSFLQSLKKAFYPHRWNPKLPVELVVRGLMLIGKI